MIIKKLQASFGKLNGDTLELKEGLNVVSLGNESGKSTWSAFILAMLYGVDTSERAGAGKMPDKLRYKPWDGRPMEGAMEIETGGRMLRLERTGKGTALMKNFKSMNLATGADAGLEGETAGQELTGMSREVFRRSALVRQGTIKIDNTADLERQLVSTATGGEDDASYGQVRDRLENWRKALKNRQGGEISRLEQEEKELEAKIEDISALARTAAQKRAELEQLSEKLKAAEQEVELHRARESLDRGREIAKARMEVMRIEAEIKKLTGGHVPPTRSALTELERRLQAIDGCAAQVSAYEEKLAQAKTRRQERVPAETPFSGLSRQDAAAKLESARNVYQKAHPVSTVMFLFTVVFAVLTIVFAMVLQPDWLPAIPAALAVICLVIAVATTANHKKTLAKMRAEADKLGQDYSRYLEDISSAEAMDEAVNRAERELLAAREQLLAADDAATSYAGEVLGGSGTSDEIRPALDAAYALVDSVSELTVRRDAAVRYRDDISKDFERQDGKYDLDSLPVPVTQRQEAISALEDAREAHNSALSELSRLDGRLSAMGDYDALFARCQEVGAKKQIAMQEYAAITSAIELLDLANEELSMKFSPMLNEKAGEYFKKLTGGKYEALFMNNAMEAQVREEGAVVNRGAEFLSAGAGDQLYLAVRLAICELLLPQGAEAPPLILDDALSNFDDTRAAAAMELLGEIAQNRQVILFTCHNREESI
ncbi:MAG: AAA family ATPase [Oscillospiraceae bacterium]|nr:AAA family ATPase [Oscillospiraceae bacterium]